MVGENSERITLQIPAVATIRMLAARLTLALGRRVTMSEAAQLAYNALDDEAFAGIVTRANASLDEVKEPQ